ncbi:competence protein [Flavobacterium sp. LM5]|uniref:phage holin family protein n=1 Tax=Flavobacterium sp. LM5 TaxID=1938610 RepID=UPI000992CB95|nr:phage holin family protein [Flavobacterium sp. LM5]OOV28641.1 competence protein [Flavobacterium sp. LM5]
MALDELKEKTDDVQEQLQAYIESNLAYYKLWGFKVVMKSSTMILKFAMILLCFAMVLLFCSVAAALALGNYFNSNALGFLVVGGLYLAVTLGLFMIKDKIVEGPILEKFSEIFFND